MRHLKRIPNRCTWNPSRTKRRNHCHCKFLQPFSIVAATTHFQIVTAVTSARWALVTDKHFLCLEMLLLVGVLLSCSVLSYQDTHCYIFANGKTLFRCKVMFEEESTFSREYTVFAPAQLLRKWREQRPSSCDLVSSVTRVVGSLGMDLLLISSLCRSPWLLCFAF
jgi:hypothetical protein